MSNVADSKLYDILGVSPSASENELKKVTTAFTLGGCFSFFPCVRYISRLVCVNQEESTVTLGLAQR